MNRQCCLAWNLVLMVYFHLKVVGSDDSLLDDLLIPYKYQHGTTRQIRDLQPDSFNYTYEIFTTNTTEKLLPATKTRYFVSDVRANDWNYYDKVRAYGHITAIRNPLRSFSVLEPRGEGGCETQITETVEETAKLRKCLVAQNGGFFNTSSGCCLGNVISDGRTVQYSGKLQNVNFGITKNGSIVVGYVSQENIEQLHFQQLIGGAIWLIRNGSVYVDEALKCESSDVEETGTLRDFTQVRSARTAIGHDHLGQVIMVQVEGQTGVRGVNLYQLARLLIDEFHLVNAINLDGGGSATLVLNGTLSNYPSDHCKSDPEWRCARAVTTIVCAHEPDCIPECFHGNCSNGICSCEPNFRGKTCDELFCGRHNCSSHGNCSRAGCDCISGWHGTDCTIPCGRGKFGKNCSQDCTCRNNGTCDSVTGHCDCAPGFGGEQCERVCELGKYGKNCQHSCQCSETCDCDPITGLCRNMTEGNSDSVFGVAQCLAQKVLRANAAATEETEQLAFHWMAVLCTTAGALAISLTVNVYLMVIKSDCNRDYSSHGDNGQEYIPLDDIDVNQPSKRSLKPFSMKSKKRTRLKSRLPSWSKLMSRFEDSRGQSSRGEYMPLKLNEDNIEIEETSLHLENR